MDFDSYRALSAENWSRLKHILKSPLHYQHALTADHRDTPAMAFGRAVHCAVLEPDEFPLRYALRPEGIDRRTKEGRERWAAFVSLLTPGTEVLDADDYARCLAIRDSVDKHPEARALLRGDGSNELTIEWTDARTGIACKGRIDRVSDSPLALVDLKTTTDVDERAFGRRARKLGYFAQLAWYADGYEAAFGLALPPVIVSVESEAPFDVAVEDFDEQAIKQGRQEYRDALAMLAWCNKQGNWPGVCPGRRLIWMAEREDDIGFTVLDDDTEEAAQP